MGTTNEKPSWPAGLPFSNGTSPLGRLSRLGGTLSVAGDAVVFVPLGGLGRTRRFPFGEIREVESHGVKPSRLLVRLHDGTEVVVIVARDRMTSIFSEDTSARDEALVAIGGKIGSS